MFYTEKSPHLHQSYEENNNIQMVDSLNDIAMDNGCEKIAGSIKCLQLLPERILADYQLDPSANQSNEEGGEFLRSYAKSPAKA
ncbi:hypothetical protein SUGI_1020670 [Cryptomeria japonica]|nr:hypothetical protein SUGI_1020670 [Cryptomeria japonica]